MGKEKLCLYDNVDPILVSGEWTLETSQKIYDSQKTIVNKGESIVASQKFIIDHTLTKLSQGTVVNRFPLPDSQGAYTSVVPHVIMKDARLPWRVPVVKGKQIPCVALLLFTQEELVQNGVVGLNETTMEEHISHKNDVWTPTIEYMAEHTRKETCSSIRITTKLFDSVCPSCDELPLLAHCRQVYIGDKAELNLDLDGLFSVILSSRIPQHPENISSVSYLACLVSLEGMGKVLDGKAVQTGCKFIDIIVLDSFSFQVNGSAKKSFRSFCKNTVSEEKEAPMLSLPITGQTGAAAERLNQGYVPLLYHLRTGDEAMGWYRSPLTPLPIQKRIKEKPFESSDSVMCYDKAFGVFDVSMATAWETGRMAALQEPSFAKNLMRLRVRGQELTDKIMSGIISRIYSSDEKELRQGWQEKLNNLADKEVKGWLTATSGGEQFFSTLTQEHLNLLGDTPKLDDIITHEGDMMSINEIDEMEHLCKELMLKKSDLISSFLGVETQMIAKWLAKLWLLYPVPFDALIPHQELLPSESIRFFFIDENWLEAAYDGAVSLGMDSSRQSSFNNMVRNLILKLTNQEMLTVRASLYGENAPKPRDDARSGFLIRSSLVAYWPTLSLSACDAEKKQLSILRMELLSSDIMFVLFDGVAETIQCIEPKECIEMDITKNEFTVLANGKLDLSLYISKRSSELAESLMSVGDCVVFKRKEK